MLNLIGKFFQNHLDVVFFIYGLAFVSMGIAILVQPRKGSECRLAGILWLLAAFGIVHGINEWLDMWAIIKGSSHSFDIVRVVILGISFFFLFEFGRQMMRITNTSIFLKKKIAETLIWWLSPLLGIIILIFASHAPDFWKTGATLSRYLLGFPGGLMVCFGFFSYHRLEKEVSEQLGINRYLGIAGLSFLAYGFLSGLVVPKGNFFPSNILNIESFYSVIKVPVQIFRAICAIGIAFSVSGVLEIFNQEMLNRLKKTKLGLERELMERKLVEEDLRESETKYRTLVEQLPAITYIAALDEVNTTLYVSPQVEKILRFSLAEYKTAPDLWRKQLYPEDHDRVMAELVSSHVSGRPFISEYRMYAKDGRLVWFRDEAVIVRDDKGNPLFLQGVMHDITERKQMEEKLHQQNEFLNNTIESLAYPFYVIDAYNYTVKMANSAAGSLTKDLPCYALTHHRDKPCSGEHICPLEEVKKTRKYVAVEHLHYDKDGNLRNVEVHGHPVFDAEGNVVQMIEYAIDITKCKKTTELLKKAYMDLKETHEELIRTEKLAALGRFSSGIAHEIKNPLAITFGGIEYLEAKLVEADSDTKIALEKMKDATSRADNIIHRLLEFSRPSGLKIEKIRLADLVNDTLDLFKYKVHLSNIEIKTQFEEEIYIEVDTGQMQQVLFNILSNAIESMPKGGEIRIKTYKTILPEFDKELPYYIIEIADTGEGIVQSDLSKVFEPFFTKKRDKKGTGLGLYISRLIVNNHKGDMIINSELGKGTVVKIILPLKKEGV